MITLLTTIIADQRPGKRTESDCIRLVQDSQLRKKDIGNRWRQKTQKMIEPVPNWKKETANFRHLLSHSWSTVSLN